MDCEGECVEVGTNKQLFLTRCERFCISWKRSIVMVMELESRDFREVEPVKFDEWLNYGKNVSFFSFLVAELVGLCFHVM